jgi:hypothetical protein
MSGFNWAGSALSAPTRPRTGENARAGDSTGTERRDAAPAGTRRAVVCAGNSGSNRSNSNHWRRLDK